MTAIRSEIECIIIDRLVDAVLKEGLSARIHDGEDWAMTHPSKSKAVLMDNFASTDLDNLTLYAADGKRVGSFLLIYGNGEDVISDHDDNPLCNRLFREAIRGENL